MSSRASMPNIADDNLITIRACSFVPQNRKPGKVHVAEPGSLYCHAHQVRLATRIISEQEKEAANLLKQRQLNMLFKQAATVAAENASKRSKSMEEEEAETNRRYMEAESLKMFSTSAMNYASSFPRGTSPSPTSQTYWQPHQQPYQRPGWEEQRPSSHDEDLIFFDDDFPSPASSRPSSALTTRSSSSSSSPVASSSSSPALSPAEKAIADRITADITARLRRLQQADPFDMSVLSEVVREIRGN